MKVSHRITRVVTAGLIAGALAAPAASARPASDPAIQNGGEPVVIEPAPVVQSIDGGFDWDSAALGAAGAGAIILLVSAGGITYRHRNQHVGVAR
jgi:hypothetical protein